ncbi:2-hydroxyacyl-CoA dehydratase family protein [Chloroflexota bacterium]
MGFLEEEIARNERRIAKIKANPDPTRAATNALRYELERDRRLSQLKALQTGKPIVSCPAYLVPVFRAMGFESALDYGSIADRVAGGPKSAHYFDRIRELGLPDNLCDRSLMYIPMVLDGELPAPDIVCGFSCEARRYADLALANMMGFPCYHIDVRFDEPSEEHLKYVTDQIHELISFTERTVPGVKYDEAKATEMMVEMIKWDRLFDPYLHDIYLARKNIPCPEAGQDIFRMPPMAANYPDPEKVVEYIKARHAEVMDKARKGIGGVANERVRLLWTTSGPAGSDIFDFLASKGASVVFFHHGHAPRSYGVAYGAGEYNRELTPLEEMAKCLIGSSWGGAGQEMD